MRQNSAVSSAHQYTNIFLILLIFLPFLAYLTPLWYAALHQHPFIFQNAWDEANYMSYQGVLGARNRPGYFALYLVGWLQDLRISGAIQNLIFATVLIPCTYYFVYLSCLKLNSSTVSALCYATVIIFSSVLFNYANFFINYFFGDPHVSQKFLMTGWDTYPSILRDPNPLFSYFLLSIFIYLYTQYKKIFFLLLPLPFLYFWVFAAYIYLLIVFFLVYRFFKRQNLLQILLSSLIAYGVLSGIILITYGAIEHHTLQLIQAGEWYSTKLKIVFPLVTGLAVVIYFCLKLNNYFVKQKILENCFIILTICTFAICNTQWITGFSLCTKNYIDYSNSIIMGLLIVITLQVLAKNIFKLTVLFFIAIFTLSSQGFSFLHYQFKIDLMGNLTDQQIDKIKQDPLHAIVIGTDYAQYLPFGYAKMLAPVLTFHDAIDFVNRQCSYNELLTRNALDFIHDYFGLNDPIRKEMDTRGQVVLSSLNKYKNIAFINRDYCQYARYAAKDFYIINPDQANRIRYFPNW